MTNNPFKFFQFPKVLGLNTVVQISLVVSLFLVQSYSAYWLLSKGIDYNGMPVEWSGILAPIYEEMIFRGIILALLLNHYNPFKAILISSLLFGLFHFRNIIYLGLDVSLFYQIFYTFGLGLLFSWITIKTKSIWSAVVLHYTNNIWAPISWMLLGLLA